MLNNLISLCQIFEKVAPFAAQAWRFINNRTESLTVGIVDEGNISGAGGDMVRRRSKVRTNRDIVDPHLFIGDHNVLKKEE
jgi:hypothetical protein